MKIATNDIKINIGRREAGLSGIDESTQSISNCGLEGLQAELAEIDENAVRTALSMIEYEELLEHRKTIYDPYYPETKAGLSQAAGMDRAIDKHVSDKMSSTSRSFAQDTAEKWAFPCGRWSGR